MYAIGLHNLETTKHMTNPLPKKIKRTSSILNLYNLFYVPPKVRWKKTNLTTEYETYSDSEYDRKPFKMVFHKPHHRNLADFECELYYVLNTLNNADKDEYTEGKRIRYAVLLGKKSYLFHKTMTYRRKKYHKKWSTKKSSSKK